MHSTGKTYVLKDMKRNGVIQVAIAARKGFRSDGTFWQKRVVLGNFRLQYPHCSCLTLQIVDAGNTAASYKAHFILVPSQWICFPVDDSSTIGPSLWKIEYVFPCGWLSRV